jgi:hypothetical protein
MRMHGIPTVCGEPISLFQTDEVLKQHPAYRLAKSGNASAAQCYRRHEYRATQPRLSYGCRCHAAANRSV